MGQATEVRAVPAHVDDGSALALFIEVFPRHWFGRKRRDARNVFDLGLDLIGCHGLAVIVIRRALSLFCGHRRHQTLGDRQGPLDHLRIVAERRGDLLQGLDEIRVDVVQPVSGDAEGRNGVGHNVRVKLAAATSLADPAAALGVAHGVHDVAVRGRLVASLVPDRVVGQVLPKRLKAGLHFGVKGCLPGRQTVDRVKPGPLHRRSGISSGFSGLQDHLTSIQRGLVAPAKHGRHKARFCRANAVQGFAELAPFCDRAVSRHGALDHVGHVLVLVVQVLGRPRQRLRFSVQAERLHDALGVVDGLPIHLSDLGGVQIALPDWRLEPFGHRALRPDAPGHAGWQFEAGSPQFVGCLGPALDA